MKKFNLFLLFSSTCILAHAHDPSNQICLKGIFPDEPEQEGVLPTLADEDTADETSNSDAPPDPSDSQSAKDLNPQPAAKQKQEPAK